MGAWPQSEYIFTYLQTHAYNLLTAPPVAIAMSLSWFFLLSPKPGAFTATTWRPTFNLKRKSSVRTLILTKC